MKNLKLILLPLLLPLAALAEDELKITTETLPAGRVDSSYSETLEAEGGEVESWSVSEGELPDGLTLNDEGTISGTPTAKGEFTFKITATGEDDETDEKPFTIKINPKAPKITSSSSLLPDGEYNKHYDEKIETEGEVTNASITEGALPTSLSINIVSDEVHIFGDPSGIDNFTFTIQVKNSINETDEKQFTISIKMPAPKITTTPEQPMEGIVNKYVSWEFSSDQPVYWSTSDPLPNGLQLNIPSQSNLNYISGIPTETGEFSFMLKVENEDGKSTSKPLTIKIEEPPPPKITSPGTLEGKVGKSDIWYFNSDQDALWSVVGNLPEGLSLSNNGSWWASSNYVYGTLTEVGVYTFTLKVENEDGSSTKEFTIDVTMPDAPTIETASLPPGTKGEYYSEVLESSDYATWSIISASGNLPPGLYIDEYGQIWGYPTATGTYTFTVLAENATSSDTKQLSITIGEEQLPPTITWSSVDDGYAGLDFNGFIRSDRAAYWSLEGNVPPGLSIEEGYTHENYISGIPTAAGEFTFTVRAANSRGYATETFTVNIEIPPPPQITYYYDPMEGVAGEYGSWYFESDQPARWSIAGGSLPRGLTLDYDNSWQSRYNYISGIPEVAGIYTFTLKVENPVAGNSSTRQFTITINPESSSPIITYNYVPTSGAVGESFYGDVYSDRYAYWNLEGNVPPGLSLENSGYTSYNYIYGIPTTAGTYTFTVRAANSRGSSIEIVTVNIEAPPPPQITSSGTLEGKVGKYSSWSLYSDQNARWSIVGGSLPEWIQFYDYGQYNWSYISGTPTEAGVYAFVLKVENENGSTTKEFTINVTMPEAPIIETTWLANGTKGENYNEYLEATDYATWSIAEGELPPGLWLNPYEDHAEINGSPSAAGTYTFTVKAENVAGSNTKQFSITIGEEQSPPAIMYSYIESPSLVGKPFYGYINSDRYANWSLEGNVPPGLDISNDYTRYAYFYGTPTEAGTYTFTVRASNSRGYATETFAISIEMPKPPTIITNALPNGALYNWYEKLLSTSAEYANWSLASGNLPPGLYLEDYYNDDTRISGVPSATGTYTFTMKAENAAGSDTKQFTITITEELQKPVIITEAMPDGSIGESYSQYLEATETVDYWEILDNLPLGLEMSYSNGHIYGIPEVAGTYTFTVVASNYTGESDAKVISITIMENNETDCIASGNVWENNKCRSKTPMEACIAAGNLWRGGACTGVPSSLPQIASKGNILLNTTGNSILLSNLPKNAKVEVYNLQGRRIYSTISHSLLTTSLTIPIQTKGMYIVKAGSQTMRATVR